MRSRTVYVITLGRYPIRWSSRLHTEILLGTTEAEYTALSQAIREIIQMRRLLLEIATVMNLGAGETAVIKYTVFE